MSQTDSIWAKIQLKCPPEKFYGFFRNHMGDLVHMFPDDYRSVQLVEGENSSLGSVIQLKYRLGGQLLTANIKLRAVDDVKKYLIYETVEGDVLKRYKVFEVRIEAVNGGLSKVGGGSFAKWSIVFEKANENVEAPEDYMESFVKIAKGVDAYFSRN